MTTENDRQVLNSILNPNLPIGEGLFDPEKENENLEKDQVPEMVLNLERLGRFAAEKGEIEESLAFFTKAIQEYPEVASCYNNRAQVYQLHNKSDLALADLEKAISLSGGTGKVAANAFCQRGMLYRKEGQDDAAMDDFRAAAALGSGFAKSKLVELNPYAAMCNAMLRNVFGALSEGKEPGQLQANSKTSG